MRDTLCSENCRESCSWKSLILFGKNDTAGDHTYIPDYNRWL